MFCSYWTVLAAMVLFLTGCNPARPTQAPPAPPPAPRTQVDPNPAPTPQHQDPTPTPQHPDPTPPTPPTPVHPKPQKPSPEETEKQKRSQLSAKFDRLTEATVANKPFYTVEIDVTNLTGKDIKVFQGAVSFTDENGKSLYFLGDTYGPVKAGETIKRGYTYLDDKADAVAYMKAHPDKVKVEFEADNIEFADDTKQKF